MAGKESAGHRLKNSNKNLVNLNHHWDYILKSKNSGARIECPNKQKGIFADLIGIVADLIPVAATIPFALLTDEHIQIEQTCELFLTIHRKGSIRPNLLLPCAFSAYSYVGPQWNS